MQKNCLRPIPSKQIVYEEDFSIDQMSFASHKAPLPPCVQSSQWIGTSSKSDISFSQKMSLLIKNNLHKHNSSPGRAYQDIIMTALVKQKRSHILTEFNEMKISINESLVLKRFYTLTESSFRLPKFKLYYKHYLKLLAKPTFNSEFINIIIHDTAKQKAQLYFDMAYGRDKKKSIQKDINANVEDVIFDSNIKETIDNYSTTMTCDSNEQLIYPSDIYKKCKQKNNIVIQVNDDVNFSESEIGMNYNKSKSNLLIQNECGCDNNESILMIMRDLKNKSRSKSKSKPKSKMNIRFKTQQNLTIKYQDISHVKKKSLKTPHYSIDKSKKISFISINPNNKVNDKKYKYIQKLNSLNKTNKNQIITNISTPNNSTTSKKSKHHQLFTLQQLTSNANILYKNYANSYKTRRLSEIETKNKINCGNISLKNNEINVCTSKNNRYSNEFLKIYDNQSKSPNKINDNTNKKMNPNSKSAQNFYLHFFSHGNSTNISSNCNVIKNNVSSNVCYKELYKQKKDNFFHNNNH